MIRDWRPASLGDHQLYELQQLEERLNVVLVAYRPVETAQGSEIAPGLPLAMRAYDRYALLNGSREGDKPDRG